MPPKLQQDCPTCCTSFTPSLRKAVECFKCGEAACSPCVRKHLLLTNQDAHCMFCKVPWQREFLDNALCATFRLREYKQHRENILCEREKSRIPETQALYDMVKERKEGIQVDIRKLTRKNQALREKIRDLTTMYESEIERNWRRIDDHRMRQREFYRILEGYVDALPNDDNFTRDAAVRASKLVMQCPKDSCRGFLNDKYICGVCSERVCNRCHATKGKLATGKPKVTAGPSPTTEGTEAAAVDEDELEDNGQGTLRKHVCSPEAVATVQHLKKSSKGCPGCGARISKIDGCDQMWCVGCHTAFSWATGEKVAPRGAIHNPHFYEWKRNNGGLQPGSVDANGCPIGEASLALAVQTVRRLTGGVPTRILHDIHREIVHIQHVDMVHNDLDAVKVDPTRGLRIQFLRGAISEADWKIALQRQEKKKSKRLESLQVYQMYTATVTDLFHRIARAQDLTELGTLHAEMVSLMHYVSQSIEKIHRRYGHFPAMTAQYAEWGAVLEQKPLFT